MQKTFCDKCGAQCRNLTVHLEGGIRHTTSRGESVAHDYIRPVDLCKDCADPLIESLKLVIVPDEDSYEKAVYIGSQQGDPSIQVEPGVAYSLPEQERM